MCVDQNILFEMYICSVPIINFFYNIRKPDYSYMYNNGRPQSSNLSEIFKKKCYLLMKTTNILSVSSKFVSLYQKNALHFTPNRYSSTVFKEHQ